MRVVFFAVLVFVCVPVAFGQAITSFSGGSEYTIYYGGSTGDVIGWTFTVGQQTWITDLGIWNADQTGGIDTDHPVGVWDGSQVLMDSTMVGPSGTVVGDWIYESIDPIIVMPGEVYTIGAMYYTDDDDYYISSASSLVTDPAVTWGNSLYPLATSMGFVCPTSVSTSYGRFGPNFIFDLTPLERSTWGEIKASF